jgi:CheY-like chemotaxis protein
LQTHRVARALHPAAASAIGTWLAIAHAMTGTSAQTKTAMVVDDDDIFRYAFTRLVASLGWTAFQVANGAEAVAECHRLKPRVIFLDIQMSGRNGYEVCGDLRAESDCREAIIVAISGVSRNFIEERALTSGFDFYFLKPISKELLKTFLDSIAA